jgi:hypothetical protein
MPMRAARLSVLVLAALALLAGCGARRDIKPRVGHELPVAPYGRQERPGSADLLAGTSTERPGRNVELHLRSEVRTDDPFDLPPKD